VQNEAENQLYEIQKFFTPENHRVKTSQNLVFFELPSSKKNEGKNFWVFKADSQLHFAPSTVVLFFLKKELF